MKEPLTLTAWVSHANRRTLKHALIVVFLLVSVLAAVGSYFFQKTSLDKILASNLATYKVSIQNGDLFQINQISSRLIDAMSVDFLLVEDFSGKILLARGSRENDANVVTGRIGQSIFYIESCSFYLKDRATGRLCLRRSLSIWWLIELFVPLFFGFIVGYGILSRRTWSLTQQLMEMLLFIERSSKGKSDIPSVIPCIREVEETVKKIRYYSLTELELTKQLKELESTRAMALMASQVAHDIKSPLAILKMVGETVEEKGSDSVLLIRESVKRMQAIVDTLQLRSKGLMGSVNYASRIPNGAAICSNVTRIVSQVCDEKSIEWNASGRIRIYFDHQNIEEILVRCDELDLIRILSNLMNNAKDAIGGSGSICLRVERVSHEARVIITDDGAGISDLALSRIGMAGNTVGKPGGWGLGLYSVQQLLSAWGGRLELVRLDSRKGTQVTVALNLAPPPILEKDTESVDTATT